jgi:hypothetical protein
MSGYPFACCDPLLVGTDFSFKTLFPQRNAKKPRPRDRPLVLDPESLDTTRDPEDLERVLEACFGPPVT